LSLKSGFLRLKTNRTQGSNKDRSSIEGTLTFKGIDALGISLGREQSAGGMSNLELQVTELFRSLHQMVHRYVASLLDSPDQAEDITQEAFVRLYVALREHATVENHRAWVFRVAYNLSIDRLRIEKRWAPLEHEQARDSTGGLDPEQLMLEQEQDQKLEAAWTRLSPQERQCLDLRAQGLRYQEIANVLGVRSSTVGNSLARGIAKIMKEVHG
jgi:RNA polymerase sigma-70 factor (ECF subfamily)